MKMYIIIVIYILESELKMIEVLYIIIMLYTLKEKWKE